MKALLVKLSFPNAFCNINFLSLEILIITFLTSPKSHFLMKIDLIAGARPNFVKIAAIIHAIREKGSTLQYRLIHTGQHYDNSLSASFFKDLQLPSPDYNLGCGSGSQGEQTAAIMLAYENLLLKEKPEICLIVGDVTSSMACAIVAKKLQIKVAHVEAGLRSFDWSMPEEINRVLIDSIADFFFTTTSQAKKVLLKTGKNENQIFFVGNTMIDTLLRSQKNFRRPALWNKIKLQEKKYLILTLHRPGNVDELENLRRTLEVIISHSRGIPIVFPAHPRTAKILASLNLPKSNLHSVEALGYLEFNYLIKYSKAVITDSGGITEEATVLGVPCLTIRNNTERPETISAGTNELIGTNPEKFKSYFDHLFKGQWKKGNIPEKWDGKTGERIIRILEGLDV